MQLILRSSDGSYAIMDAGGVRRVWLSKSDDPGALSLPGINQGSFIKKILALRERL